MILIAGTLKVNGRTLKLFGFLNLVLLKRLNLLLPGGWTIEEQREYAW